MPTTRQLLRRHAAPFAVSLVALTALLIAFYAAKHLPRLIAEGAPAGAYTGAFDRVALTVARKSL